MCARARCLWEFAELRRGAFGKVGLAVWCQRSAAFGFQPAGARAWAGDLGDLYRLAAFAADAAPADEVQDTSLDEVRVLAEVALAARRQRWRRNTRAAAGLRLEGLGVVARLRVVATGCWKVRVRRVRYIADGANTGLRNGVLRVYRPPFLWRAREGPVHSCCAQ